MLKKTSKQTLARRVARPTQTSIATNTRPGVAWARPLIFIGIAVAMTFTSLASAKHFGDWGAPVNAESIPGTSPELNTTSNEGYPILSPNGLSLYIVSDRPGGLGGLDIWVARRAHKHDPWGAPENLDIYFTRSEHDAWDEPQNLGCEINSAASEAGPSYFEDECGQAILYFSSFRAGGFTADIGPPDSDIYFSVDFSSPQLAPGVNTAFNDNRPNVRKDGREIVFDSNRPGGFGLQDIWTASRDTTDDDWLTPTNLGPLVNSALTDARPTLSRDGLTMFFGSNRAGTQGLSDIYMTSREKLKGKNH